MTRYIVTLSAIVLAGCSGESTTSLPQSGSVTFTASNALIAPITIQVDGSPYLILSTGRSSQITVPARTRLTWTSAKPADAQGKMIPDEIGVVQVDASSIPGALEITNVIGYQTYFTARFFNFTDLAVSIGVFDGSKVWCAAQLPAATATSPGFTLIGYYRVLSTTEVRAYTASTDCTGPFTAWSASQLTGLEPKSGLLTLSLEPAS
jgi:hypothetical protein